MSYAEPSFTVTLDVLNPGQFFACCGLMELSHRLSPTAGIEAWFGKSEFCIVAPDTVGDVLGRVLAALRDTKMSVDDTRGEGATHPVYVDAFGITLDWWIDHHRGTKSALKMWAGQQSSAGILNELRKALPALPHDGANGLLDVKRPLTGRFGVDPRAAWNGLDVGFSPNEQGMEVDTFPAVELLAAVGLQGFRPLQEARGTFDYSMWTVPLPLPVARAASAGLLPAGHGHTYRFQIASRGSYKGFDYAIRIGDHA